MIGSGYKKFAENNGMKAAHGVGYGVLHGYAVTLSEGAGYKAMVIATRFPDAARQLELQNSLDQKAMSKQYRVQNLVFSGNSISVIFSDSVGTLKKIEAFADWFFPKLDAFGAVKANICPECGTEITDGCWKLIDGVAHYLHPACADHACAAIRREEQTARENDTGSYGTGLIGALLGSAVGSVLWAIVLALGFVAGIVGYVICLLADKGYQLLRGKHGKGKIAILIIAVVFGVLLGTFLGEVIAVAQAISSGELSELSYGDIPLLLLMLLELDAEFRGAIITNVLVGLVFAALGVWGVIKKTADDVSDAKIADLP